MPTWVLGQAVTTFFFLRIKLIYNISLSRKMYILYLYILQDTPDLLCLSMGGMFYRIIWLHYKAISENHFVPQETIHRQDPITQLFADNSKHFC